MFHIAIVFAKSLQLVFVEVFRVLSCYCNERCRHRRAGYSFDAVKDFSENYLREASGPQVFFAGTCLVVQQVFCYRRLALIVAVSIVSRLALTRDNFSNYRSQILLLLQNLEGIMA